VVVGVMTIYKIMPIIKYLWGLLLVPIFFYTAVYGQKNLILNGDFEELSLIDFSKTTIDGQSYKGNRRDTSLLWNLDKKRSHVHVSSPYWNFIDTQKPTYNTRYSKTGRSNSGFVYIEFMPLHATPDGKYHIKNIVGETCKPLIKNNTYELSFWIRPFSGNHYINSIDVHFDSTQHHFDGYVRYQKRKKKQRKETNWVAGDNFKPTILSQDCVINLPSKDDKKYVQVSCKYKAKGGEKYVYIGNLTYDFPKKIKKKDLKTYGEQRPIPVATCIYAIDDVNLISKTDTTEKCDMQLLRFMTNKGKNISYRDPTATQQIDEFILSDNDFENYQLKSVKKTSLKIKLDKIDFERIEYIIIIEYNDKLTGFSVKDMPLKYSRSIKEVLSFSSSKTKIYTRRKLKNQPNADRVKILIYYR